MRRDRLVRAAPRRLFALCWLGCLLAPAQAIEPERLARACPRHGPGFVEVPGTPTCIRIGGRVTAGYGAASRRHPRDEVSGAAASARISADVRTETPYGPLRAFVRVRTGSGR